MGFQPPSTSDPDDRRRKRQVSLRTRKREESEDSKKKKDAKKELEANKLETSKTLNKDKRVTRKDRSLGLSDIAKDLLNHNHCEVQCYRAAVEILDGGTGSDYADILSKEEELC
ncbi:hypothetical protein BLNAU_23684 [Blattamonas nauphoetae]|uniref:Uncharacterized protein n=1 Tax=Blattamonas nauphoetae TaxID=2049346 RepID=A0ABQ9WPI8_9EUKA|nr:hypothetical protein BLNAU_23684 [Blattamonas nauphoetae]